METLATIIEIIGLLVFLTAIIYLFFKHDEFPDLRDSQQLGVYMLASAKQLKLLRLLQRILHITNDEFNEAANPDGAGDVEFRLAKLLIDKWKAEAISQGKWQERGTVLKYDNLGQRKAHFATPIQLRKIDGLWSSVSRQETEEERDEAFKEFLQKHFKIMSVENIKRGDIGKLVKTLEKMQTQMETQMESKVEPQQAMKFGGVT